MTYTEKQLKIMRMWQQNKLKRINIFEGSVSSGKTWISLVLWAFWVATMPADKPYMMCAKTLTTLKRNCLEPLTELVGESNFSYRMSAKEARLFGRLIHLEGANDKKSENKIRGMTLQGVYCDEVTLFPEDFFEMLMSRLRLPFAKLFGTTNPDRPSHWLKKNYIDRAGELSLLVVKFLLDDNTFLPQDYIDNLKKEYTGVFYERFILGKWVLAEGLIFPMYNEALREPPEGEQPKRHVLAIDYGTLNAFAAILWEEYSDGWYGVDMYYYSGREHNMTKTDSEYCDDLDRKFGRVFATQERKLQTIVDPSAASLIAELRKRGLYAVRAADNEVLKGISMTGTALKNGYIYISPTTMKPWIDEAEGYVWDDNESADRPVKANDHAMDATRYFVATMKINAKPQPNRTAGLSLY